jgi:hypothetical protein
MSFQKVFRCTLPALLILCCFSGCHDPNLNEPGAYIIAGSVVSTNGGLSGVLVSAGQLSVTTDSSGSFAIYGVGNGTYTVVLSKAGYTFTPAAWSVIVENEKVSGVDFEGSRCASQVLVASYALDGDAKDGSGNDNDGIVHGAAPTADRFGNDAAAFDFNGSSYIEVPDAPALNPTQAISVAAWFSLRSLSGSYPPIVKKMGAGAPYLYGYALECHPDPGGSAGPYVGPAVMFSVDANGSGGNGPIWAPITLNEWHLAVGVYDGSSLKLYVDGCLKSSAPCSGSIFPSPNPLNIGRDPADTGRRFDGKIDEVRIYNCALSPSEVQELYVSSCP